LVVGRGSGIGLIVALLSVAVNVQAEEKEKEPFAIVELGGAGGWSLSGGGSSFGPSAGIEFEPIKNWLEIEVGTAPLFGNGHAQLDTDILFKKPFSLSDKMEFMVGAGPPGATRSTGRGNPAPSSRWISCSGRRLTENTKYGWFVEPSYSCSFGSEHEQSLGVSFGLLIAIQ
jgi:hypothetical protein